MPAKPWKSFAMPVERREYVALVTFLPLKRFRTLPQFVWLTLQTIRQLARSKGLIGYALDADIGRLNFWTLSAWEDRQSLTEFVRAMPHARIMRIVAPLMRQTQFVYWKADAEDIPLRWDQAKARLR
jgi:hypothetical protein